MIEEEEALFQRILKSLAEGTGLSADDRATVDSFPEEKRIEWGSRLYRKTFVCNICEEIKKQKKSSLTE